MMSGLQRKYDDEIDLLDLIEKVWDGKWKIALFIILGIFIAFGYNIIKAKNFIATTEIRPITTFEEDKYRLFNQSPNDNYKTNDNDNNKTNNNKIRTEKNNKYKDIVIQYLINNKDKNIAEFLKREEKDIITIFEITNRSLLNQYVEEIKEGPILEIGIKKFNLIDKDKFDDEKVYIEKVKKFASEIIILAPQNIDGKEKREIIPYHTIKAKYNDIEKWKKLLVFIDFEVNKKVKNIVTNRFETIISVLKQKKDFELEDLNTRIENVKQDYEEAMKNRLAFLAEQASIARKLGISKNTIENQNFITLNSLTSNVKTINTIYLRGYIAIEEEMRLINNRKNKTSFMQQIYKLQQQKRILEQDKRIHRANNLFANTPIKQDAFKATSVNVSATEYVYEGGSKLKYIAALIIGGMMGVVFVLIENSFAKRKKTIVTS